MIDLDLGGCCPDFSYQWQKWLTQLRNPAAFLSVCQDEQYMQNVGSKARNMCRKGAKTFFGCRFDYNNHLEDMYRINRSMPIRQGKPMTQGYREMPEPISNSWDEDCDHHKRVWLGVFKNGIFVSESMGAYCQLVVCGNLAIVNRIIGDPVANSLGAMSVLVRYINEWCGTPIGGHFTSRTDYTHSKPKGIEYVNYLDMKCSQSLAAFKKHVGFRELEWRAT